MNPVLRQKIFPAGKVLELVQGDITAEAVDAIVNAANARLQHGGGVAWAIAKKGGPSIQQESDRWVQTRGPVTHSHPAWTTGGRLPAKYVIHAVGPVWGEGEEDPKLFDAVTGSLHLADKLGCASLALPAISTGIYGFPRERAAGIIFSAIQACLQTGPHTLSVVRLVLFDRPTADIFLRAWQEELGE